MFFTYMNIIKKALNIFQFFKATVLTSILISLPTLLFGDVGAFIVVYLTLGFVVSILIKEINYEKEYLFYYNNGISKIQLWFYSYIMATLTALLFAALIILIKIILK